MTAESEEGPTPDGPDGAPDVAPDLSPDVSPSAIEAASSDEPALKGSAKIARALLDASDMSAIADHARSLNDGGKAGATKAARILSEVAVMKPDALVPHVERLVRALTAPHKRVVQTASEALPAIVKVAPARVAKHLNSLRESYEGASSEGRDGLVRTFTALCLASVAYQKRLEPTLTRALSDAEPKTMVVWMELVLPALKGEPHANARAVVEGRIAKLPKPQAQKVADFLGIKLRRR